MKNQPSLSASTAWYSLGNFFIRSISFLLIPFYSNLLTTGEYGNYALLMSLYSIAAVLYQAGLQSGLTKFYLEAGHSGERRIIFSTVFNSVVLTGLALTVLSLAFSGYISTLLLGSKKYQHLIILLFLSLLIETLGYFVLHLLKTKEQPAKVVIFSAAGSLVNLSLNIVFVYSLRMNVSGILIAQLISALVIAVISLPSVYHELSFKIDPLFLRKLLYFSLPLFISGLLASAVDVSDRFILDIFTDKNQVGIYSLSYRIALVMNVFIISFRAAWAPYGLNLYNKDDYKVTFGQTLKKFLAAGCFIILAVVLFAPFLFDLRIANFFFINEAYRSGLIILPMVLTGYLFNGLSSLYSIYPLASGKSYHFLISDGLAFIFNIAINFILIPKWGMLGAALATLLSFIAGSIYLIVLSTIKVKVEYPLKEIILIIFSAFILLLTGNYFRSLTASVSFIVIYLIILLFFAKINLKRILRMN